MMPVALFAAGIFLSMASAAEEHSTIAPLASQALLLDAQARAGRIVAVGERGHVLVSQDQGQTWRQVAVPTRKTLTAIAFADERVLVAVGHQGSMVRSEDSGETWKQVQTGAAQDSSFLDVVFLDSNHGFAVGAYGLFMGTADGGVSWKPRTITDDGFHYNRIVLGRDGTLYIAGEAGTLLRSMDSGETWDSIPTPYEGSFFGLLDLGNDSQLAFGLRGHVYRSTTRGDDWEEVSIPVPTLVMSGTELPDGRIVLAGQSGNFLLSRDRGESFSLWHWGASTGVAEILSTTSGALLVFGEAGAKRIPLPTNAGETEP